MLATVQLGSSISRSRQTFIRLLILLSEFHFAFAQPAGHLVTIRVDAAAQIGPFKPIWRFFGYDEPNYTYTPNGRKLISELSALSPIPVFIRTHNLLTTGDGTPALKWGSTNAYTEDAAGRPVYDWTIIDRIIDTYVHNHVKPFMEIGFMPQALSVHPEPYRHTWPKGGIDTGWAYPPKDYAKWRELVFQWVKHSLERYGRQEVESWYWEVWNEPNISYWHGTPEEFDKLYDYAALGVKRALPSARVGGPATTGPLDPKAAEFLRQFLSHCVSGANRATGKIGAPLDFITFHAKGRPEVVDGNVRMGIATNLRDVASGLDVVASVSAVPAIGHHSERVRPGRLRRLLGPRPSTECLSQWPALRRLHCCGLQEHSESRRSTASKHRRHADLGF